MYIEIDMSLFCQFLGSGGIGPAGRQCSKRDASDGEWGTCYDASSSDLTIPEDPCMEYLPTLTPKVI